MPDDQNNDQSMPGDWAGSVNQMDNEVYNISELEASDIGPEESPDEGSDVDFHDQHASMAMPQVWLIYT